MQIGDDDVIFNKHLLYANAFTVLNQVGAKYLID